MLINVEKDATDHGDRVRDASRDATTHAAKLARTQNFARGGRTRMHSDNGAKERPTQRAQEAHKLIKLRGPTSSAHALEAPYLLSITSMACLS